MTALILILGVVLGAGAAYLVSRVRVRAANEQLAELRVQNQALDEERRAALADVSGLRDQLGGDRVAAHDELTRVRGELATAERELAAVESTLKAEREAHQERVAELLEREKRIDDRAKAAASDALRSTTPQLIALARSELGKERAEAKREIDAEHKRVAGLVDGVDKTLTRVANKLDDVERERIAGRQQLAEQLKAMRESQGELMAGTQALVGALRRPHIRGRWGEVQLRNIVEAAGMLPHVDFDEQPSLPGEDGVLRPDACVHMPGQRDVVIDAKVPLEAYLESISATDPAEQDRLLGEHARHLRGHLAALDSKSYWERLECSPDFVIMFVPNDQVLLAAMEADRSLAELVQRHKVVIATPMNLMALLRIIAIGWRQETLAANAREVETLGRDLYKRLGTFARHLNSLGKKIGTLVKGYNDAVGSFDRMVLPGARRFVELGAVAPDNALADISEVTQIPRELHPSDIPALPPGVEGEGAMDDDEPEAGEEVSAA